MRKDSVIVISLWCYVAVYTHLALGWNSSNKPSPFLSEKSEGKKIRLVRGREMILQPSFPTLVPHFIGVILIAVILIVSN